MQFTQTTDSRATRTLIPEGSSSTRTINRVARCITVLGLEERGQLLQEEPRRPRDQRRLRVALKISSGEEKESLKRLQQPAPANEKLVRLRPGSSSMRPKEKMETGSSVFGFANESFQHRQTLTSDCHFPRLRPGSVCGIPARKPRALKPVGALSGLHDPGHAWRMTPFQGSGHGCLVSCQERVLQPTEPDSALHVVAEESAPHQARFQHNAGTLPEDKQTISMHFSRTNQVLSILELRSRPSSPTSDLNSH